MRPPSAALCLWQGAMFMTVTLALPALLVKPVEELGPEHAATIHGIPSSSQTHTFGQGSPIAQPPLTETPIARDAGNNRIDNQHDIGPHTVYPPPPKVENQHDIGPHTVYPPPPKVENQHGTDPPVYPPPPQAGNNHVAQPQPVYPPTNEGTFPPEGHGYAYPASHTNAGPPNPHPLNSNPAIGYPGDPHHPYYVPQNHNPYQYNPYYYSHYEPKPFSLSKAWSKLIHSVIELFLWPFNRIRRTNIV